MFSKMPLLNISPLTLAQIFNSKRLEMVHPDSGAARKPYYKLDFSSARAESLAALVQAHDLDVVNVKIRHAYCKLLGRAASYIPTHPSTDLNLGSPGTWVNRDAELDLSQLR
jgi:hypothetical protein